MLEDLRGVALRTRVQFQHSDRPVAAAILEASSVVEEIVVDTVAGNRALERGVADLDTVLRDYIRLARARDRVPVIVALEPSPSTQIPPFW